MLLQFGALDEVSTNEIKERPILTYESSLNFVITMFILQYVNGARDCGC